MIDNTNGSISSLRNLFPLNYVSRVAMVAAVAVGMTAAVGCEDDDAEIELETSAASTAGYGLVNASFTAQDGEARSRVRAGEVGEMQTSEAEGEAITLRKMLPDRIVLGEPMEYTIEVSAGDDLSNVIVNEKFPQGFDFESSQPEGRMSDDGQTLRIDMGAMGADETATVTIRGTAQEAGQFELCTTYDYERGLCSPIAVVNPSLLLMKQGPEMVNVCEPINFTYILRNDGDTASEDVVLFDQLPEGLMTADGSREVRFEIDEIGAGEEVRREIQALAGQVGTFESYAYAESELLEVRSKRVNTEVVGPELNVRVNTQRNFDYIGKNARFDVIVENTGEAPALNTAIAMELDGIGEIVGVDGNFADGAAELDGNAVAVGTIPAGESRRFAVEVRGDDSGQARLKVGAASVCAINDAQLASAAASSTLEFRALSALQVEVVDSQDPVKVGGETSYELTIINEGTGVERNLTVSAQLPEGVSFVDGQGPTEAQQDGDTVTFGKVEELAAGESVTWYVTVRVDQATGSQKLTLNAKTDDMDEAIIEEEPTRLY